jgi:two-component system sensor kinase
VFPRETWGGLWGQALIDRQTVLSNSPGRVPAGHIPIARSIFAPITHHDEVIGLLAVANRDRDYGRADAERLEHIASHVAPILSARLTRDFFAGEQARVADALRESEARYRAIVDHQSELVLRFDADGVLTFVNDALCRYTQTPREDLLGGNVFDLVSAETAERTRQHLATLTVDRPVGQNDIEWLNPEGGLRWISWINHAFFDEEGRATEFQSVGRDDTERRRQEENLRWALGEKELLLKEIHHRVKNNLAVISGMLRLQAAGLEDHRVNDVFDTMQKRIRTMALVHEQLYRSGRFGEVALKEYLGRVLESLRGGPERDRTPPSISADIDDVILQIDQAIPCGLIVTELVNNALQHGFPEGGGGSIRVSLRSRDDGRHELTVRDDGVGLPVGDRDENGSGFGLEMVGLLATQLGGTMDVCSRGGTEVKVLFPGDAG